MQAHSPYIVTLLLNEEAFSFFNTLRQKHFPPAFNYLSAHLTLFHHLPSTEQKIKDDLQRWADQTKSFSMHVNSVVSIGKGVAYKLDGADLAGLHKRMQQEWQQWLTPQDRQKLWPHVTVQNKVSPVKAKETAAILQENFQPFSVEGVGFGLWHYEGGPWRFAQEFRFRAE